MANILYGVDMTQEEFEELGLDAWGLIGNKRTRTYRYVAHIQCVNSGGQIDHVVELPCNADILEAVTYNYEDWNYTTNTTVNGDYNSQFTENYIETRKLYDNPLYMHGKYAKYEQVGDYLYFDKNYGPINILYRGVILDDDGLPELSDKETRAIASYCAYRKMNKEGLVTRNKDTIEISQSIYQEWLKYCDAARVPEYLNQNDMNQILDAKSNWNRKIFNRSYKPVK